MPTKKAPSQPARSSKPSSSKPKAGKPFGGKGSSSRVGAKAPGKASSNKVAGKPGPGKPAATASKKATPAKGAPSKPSPAKPAGTSAGPGPAAAAKKPKAAPSIQNPPREKKARRPIDTSGVTKCGTIALVGRPNVGKSSLLNALLGQKIAATTHKPQTTRRALRGILTEGNTQLIFVDTPGLHEEQGGLFSFMLDEALDAAADTDVLVFMVEADRHRQGIRKEDEEALERVIKRAPKKPILLVINKIDVLEDKAVLLPLLQAWGATGHFSGYVPLSAHKRENLDGLAEELGRLVPEGPFLLPPDSLTDQSERDICAEMIREKVMLELQQEIPYRTAVIVEVFDESRREDPRKPLVHIAAIIVVERDSHKSIIIGKGGIRIKTIGQRARKDLEHLLMCQVHLELFAKVEKDWTQTGGGLRKLGYIH